MNSSSIARWLYPYGSVRAVLRGPVKGARFIVVPGMGVTYALGQDHWNFHFLKDHVRPGGTVYDIGANCGQLALLFGRLVGAKGSVVCFEPVPQNFAVLEKNLQMNALHQVKPCCLAVADHSGGRTFTYDCQHHTMGTFTDRIAKVPSLQETIEVTCVTLDEFVTRGHPPPDVLKIDVEGAGAEVLAGAARLLRRRRPAIYMEIHSGPNSESPEWEALHRLKTDFGYTIHDVNHRFDQERGSAWDAAAWCEHK